MVRSLSFSFYGRRDRPHGRPESCIWCILCVRSSSLTLTTSICEGFALCKSRMALSFDILGEELEFKIIEDTRKEIGLYPLMYGRGAAPSTDV